VLSLGGANLLPITPIAQQNQVWSWASAAEMALRSAGLPQLAGGTYRCGIVASRFGSCQPNCAGCLAPVATGTALVRALEAYQQAVAGGTAAFEAGTAARLKPKAIVSMIRGQRRPIFAQVTPRGGGAFYPAGMRSHFALIVGIAGTGQQARLTVNDPYPYPEAANPYLATGVRTAEPGQYRISYGDFRERLGWRQSVVLR
jgi:hypothetical protein